uniref:Uncharacterized protein n=1 Tax=Arundo donax TaxID=35708 RepID=A0A0A9TYU1_ARUDO
MSFKHQNVIWTVQRYRFTFWLLYKHQNVSWTVQRYRFTFWLF